MSSELHEKADAAVRALRDLQAAALGDCGAVAADPTLDLSDFCLFWHTDMGAAELVDEALKQAAEVVSEHHIVRTGHVYCYACGSASCDHAVMPAPGAVFTGYESTGRPAWEELFNFLLQLGDNRTDLLFAPRPEVLARVVGRRRLTSEQLVSFGKNSLTYRIWGQVVAGHIMLKSLRSGLTAQLVETRDHRLHLQVITDPRVRDALANAPADKRSAFHRIFDAIAHARREVFSLSGLWQSNPQRKLRGDVEKRGFAILRHLAHSLERKGRQHYRRTAHAEVRGQQRRPVHKAHDDLVEASATDFLSDTVKHSVIVLGRAGRLHAFSEQGRHITSLILKGDELERRRRRRRYLPLDKDRIDDFRKQALSALPQGKPDAPARQPRTSRVSSHSRNRD